MLRRSTRGESISPDDVKSSMVDLTHINSDDDSDGDSCICLGDDELDGQPRIISSVGYQTLSTPLIATLSQKEVKVTVKWKQPRINGYRQSKRIKVAAKSNSQVDTASQDSTTIDQQYPPSDKFAVGENIFAWDRGHLYKAKVLKSKDVCGEMKYYIHYSGYKKGHRRWLTLHELIQINPSSQKFYDNQMTLTLGGDDSTKEDKVAINKDKGHRKRVSQDKPQPDTVTSKRPTVEEESYDEDDYKSLHERYLMPRIREKVELPGGRMLRRQCKGRMIDQKNSKGFRMLRIKVDSLLKKNRHDEVYRLLCQLRNWELDPRRIPSVFKDCGDEAVKEVLDLTKEEEEDGSGNTCIDVDDFITDVLLPSHTPSSNSLPECPTSGVMQVRPRRVSPDQSTKASSCDNSDVQESSPSIRVKKERTNPPVVKKRRRPNQVNKKNKGRALNNKTPKPKASQKIQLTYGALEEVESFVYSVIETMSKNGNLRQRRLNTLSHTSRPRQTTPTNDSNPQGIDLYSKDIKWDDIPKPPGQLTIDECRRFYVNGGAKRHARHQGRSSLQLTGYQYPPASTQQYTNPPHQQSLLAQHNMRLQQYTTPPSQQFPPPPDNHHYNIHPRQQSLLAQHNMMLPLYTSLSHQQSANHHQQDYSLLAQQMLFQMIDGVSVPSQHVSLPNVPMNNTKPQVVTPDTKQKSSRRKKKRKLPTNMYPSIKAETQHRLLVKDFGFPPCQKDEVEEARSSTSNRITKREQKSHQLDSFHPPTNKRLRRLQKAGDHPNLTPTFNILPQTRMSVPPKPIIDCTISLKDGWNRQNAQRRTGKWTPAGHLTGRWRAPDWATKSSTVPASKQLKGCKKRLLPKLDSLMSNFMIEVDMEHIPEKPRPFKSLQHVKCTIYAKLNTLRSAHHAVQQLLPKGDCEDWEVVELARKYYNYWRPKETKVILLAESHAFTTKDRAFEGPGLDENILPEYEGPRGFLSLVYSLGYGENEALTGQAVDKSNKGTPQFWTLFAACSRGVDHVAATNNTKTKCASPFAADLLKGGGLPVEERLKAKLEVLEDLKRRGIWLLDASIFGWFISQPQTYTRSSVSNEVHRKPKSRPPLELKAPSLVLSWELFTKHLVRHVADEGNLKLLIPIGMEVEAALTRDRLEEAVKGKSQVRVTDTFPAPNGEYAA